MRNIYLFSLSVLLAVPSYLRANELENYIAKEDNALAYPIDKEFSILDARVLNVRLTSQEWRGVKWNHWLTVIVPPIVDPHQKGVLIIEGGTSDTKAPKAFSRSAMVMAATATQLRSPIAILLQVPNQPLFDNLYEDDLIAHTFQQFLDGKGKEWPALLPMTKSATRAMDALTSLAREGKLETKSRGKIKWNQFIVTGASKRGWTTYLTAAVDKRVCAMAPQVIDILDMKEQMKRQQMTYGKFSEMIKPYTKRGLQKRITSSEGEQLNRIVDPFSYLKLYTMPKLIMLGTNDQYWTADAAEIYFDSMPSPKSLYYMPNAGHGLGPKASATRNSFFAAQLDGVAYPELEYKVEGTKIHARWMGQANAIELWSAHSPNRDFRNQQWTAEELKNETSKELKQTKALRTGATAQITKPNEGWAAYFFRVTFPPIRKGMSEFQLSTPITILPKTFPHSAPE